LKKRFLLLLLSICFNQLAYAEQEYSIDMAKIGYLYDHRQDYDRAFTFYTKAAHQGDAISQYNLGVMYKDSKGVNKDIGEAIFWLEKASNQGLLEAQYLTGLYYLFLQKDTKLYIDGTYWITAYWINLAKNNINTAAKDVWKKLKS
jgi:TPR repeat protein